MSKFGKLERHFNALYDEDSNTVGSLEMDDDSEKKELSDEKSRLKIEIIDENLILKSDENSGIDPTDYDKITNVLELPRPKIIIMFKILVLVLTMGTVLFIFILDGREIGMNFYAYKSVMAFIDIPFALTIDPIIRKKSYKYCYKIFYSMCILSTVLLVFVKIIDIHNIFEFESFSSLLILGLIGRGAVCAMWNLCYILIVVHMPVGVRTTTLGFAAGIAALGGVTAPIILKTKVISNYLPDVMSLCALVLTYFVTHDIPQFLKIIV